MDNIKKKFKEDPIFAVTVIGIGAVIATGLLKATANTITASAYAYRASRI